MKPKKTDIEIAGEHQPLIIIPKAKLCATGMEIEQGISFREWEAMGGFWRKLNSCSAWWIADWINYGERAYGEKYTQAVSETGLDAGTLMNMAYVGNNVENSRRRENLSFEHHKEVAKLTAEDQDKWLNAANELQLSSKELRASVKAGKVIRGETKQGTFGGINTIQGWSGLAVKWIEEAIKREPLDKWSKERKSGISTMVAPVAVFYDLIRDEPSPEQGRKLFEACVIRLTGGPLIKWADISEADQSAWSLIADRFPDLHAEWSKEANT